VYGRISQESAGTPAAARKLTPKLTGYFGYSLGNSDLTRSNYFFYAEVGVNFD
jgi:hypothetical protein